ncbi:putative methyltransferase-domain-containing protein [Tirmania nivea]|nr:putative methyltransferase-domain-containing protein [Tirmania nivea]
MPLYLRFLKPPRCTLSRFPKTNYLTVSTLVTITSDLGESFYPYQATLKCDLLGQDSHPSNNNETYLISSVNLMWNAGSRNLKVEMNTSIPPGGYLAKRDCELVLRVSSENPKCADNLLDYQPGLGIGIISAWSASFKIPEPGVGSSAGGFVERRLQLSRNSTLRVWEETGESIARHIWDGGIALAAYLAQYHQSNEGSLALLQEKLREAKQLKVLELGSGCGIVGLALAALRGSCHVLLTDLPSAEEISQRNLQHSQKQLQGDVSFQILDWDDPVPPSTSPDIILIADCTYNPDSAASLVRAIEKCVNGSRETIIALAHKKRHDSETLFFDLMGKHFQMVNHSEFSTLPAKHARLF